MSEIKEVKKKPKKPFGYRCTECDAIALTSEHPDLPGACPECGDNNSCVMPVSKREYNIGIQNELEMVTSRIEI